MIRIIYVIYTNRSWIENFIEKTIKRLKIKIKNHDLYSGLIVPIIFVIN